MRPVDQTRYGFDGNCWAACVASLLEVALADLPEVSPGPQRAHYLWLQERGLVYLEVPRGSLVAKAQDEPPRAETVLGWSPVTWGMPGPLCILCGPSPRFVGIQHCVVGTTNGYGYDVLHDPHHHRDGLKDVTAIGYLVQLDVALRAK